MQTLHLDQIVIRERQRKKAEKEKLDFLVDSIRARGLLQPPGVVWEPHPETGERVPFLVYGGRRLEALRQIYEAGDSIFFNNRIFAEGEIPVVDVSHLSGSDLLSAEFEENEARESLSWQDKTAAIAAIHRARLDEAARRDEPAPSLTSTAESLIESGASVGRSPTGDTPSLGWARQKVAHAVALEAHLSDPTIAKARNEHEAYQLLLQKEAAVYEAEALRRQTRAASDSGPARIEVRQGSLLEILPRLDNATFDAIIADPPYGVGAGAGGFRQRSVQHHNYEDTPEVAKELVQAILTEGFRITKSRANLILFIDIRLFDWIINAAKRVGWVPFPTPLTWVKSTEGLAPWGRLGPRRTCEWLIYATKGQMGMTYSPTDVLDYRRVSRSEREYGPEKPVDLMMELVRMTCPPDSYILDPCCGSGSSLAAARRLGHRALGIDLSQEACNYAIRKAYGASDDAPPAAGEEAEPASLDDL